MSEIIDSADTYCSECGVRVVKPPRRKYCSDECARKAQLRQKVEYWHKKYGSGSLESSLETSLESSSKVDNPAAKNNVNFPLALPASPEQTEQVIAIIQQAFKPLFFGLNQRLVETNQRIQSVEEMQDEMFFTFYQSPAFQQQMKRQQYEIAEAKRLIIQMSWTTRSTGRFISSVQSRWTATSS